MSQEGDGPKKKRKLKVKKDKKGSFFTIDGTVIRVPAGLTAKQTEAYIKKAIAAYKKKAAPRKPRATRIRPQRAPHIKAPRAPREVKDRKYVIEGKIQLVGDPASTLTRSLKERIYGSHPYNPYDPYDSGNKVLTPAEVAADETMSDEERRAYIANYHKNSKHVRFNGESKDWRGKEQKHEERVRHMRDDLKTATRKADHMREEFQKKVDEGYAGIVRQMKAPKGQLYKTHTLVKKFQQGVPVHERKTYKEAKAMGRPAFIDYILRHERKNDLGWGVLGGHIKDLYNKVLEKDPGYDRTLSVEEKKSKEADLHVIDLADQLAAEYEGSYPLQPPNKPRGWQSATPPSTNPEGKESKERKASNGSSNNGSSSDEDLEAQFAALSGAPRVPRTPAERKALFEAASNRHRTGNEYQTPPPTYQTPTPAPRAGEAKRPPTGTFTPPPREQTIEEKLAAYHRAMSGRGDVDQKYGGLYGSEIDAMLSKYRPKGYVGVYAKDELGKVPVDPNAKYIAWVMNLSPHTATGSHWVAIVYCRDRKSINYFDSLAKPCPDDVLEGLKKIFDKLKVSYLVKMKENKIKLQSDDSDECGYYAAQRIIDMLNGEEFADCSGFNKIAAGEKDIKKFIAKVKPFPRLLDR